MKVDPRVAFALALVGGLVSVGTALMLALVLAAILAQGADVEGVAVLRIVFGWLIAGGAIGGIVLLASASSLRRERAPRQAVVAAFVGGSIAILGGNVLGGALGIAAGVLRMGPE